MLVPRVGSCLSVRLPGALGPCVLRVASWVGSPGASGFRLRCSVVCAGSSSSLGRWSGRGFVLVPLSAVGRVLPALPFASARVRAALRAPLCARVPASAGA